MNNKERTQKMIEIVMRGDIVSTDRRDITTVKIGYGDHTLEGSWYVNGHQPRSLYLNETTLTGGVVDTPAVLLAMREKIGERAEEMIDEIEIDDY